MEVQKSTYKTKGTCFIPNIQSMFFITKVPYVYSAVQFKTKYWVEWNLKKSNQTSKLISKL